MSGEAKVNGPAFEITFKLLTFNHKFNRLHQSKT